MTKSVIVFDPTAEDSLSKVRGIGRYLQILKENFPDWDFEGIVSSDADIFINPFFNFLQTPLVMRRVSKKQVAVIHDLIPLKYPDYFPIGIWGKINVFLNKLSLKNYDAVITDSEASKRDIVKILGFPEDKVRIVYPCLSKMFTKKKNASYFIPNTSYCLYVGDATWNKNLVNIAKAIKILNVTCVFAGKVFEAPPAGRTGLAKNGWQKELKNFYYEIKDDKRFVLKGFVPDDELISLYQNARMNLLVSHDEGFGFSFFEAASQNCPSILSDIPVLHEMAADAAVFTNPDDPNDIANAIGELYWNNEKRGSLGMRARKRIGIVSATVFRKKFLSAIK